MATNKAWTLASRPSGPVSEDNFKLVESEAPRPKDGEVLVKSLWLSLDPYMRFRMDDVKSYAPSVQIGEVMVGQGAGEVVESKHPAFKQGDTVLVQSGWQLYACAKGDDLTKVDAGRAPLSYYLGVLGMPGMTAYFGMKEVGAPKPGETVVDLSYRYIPQDVKLNGHAHTSNVVVPRINFEDGTIDPGHHKELRTINTLAQLDVTYGLTPSLTLAVAVPFMNQRSEGGAQPCGVPSLYTSARPWRMPLVASVMIIDGMRR
jgi:hypothetical protein